MTDKCVNTGNWFTPCKSLKKATDAGMGDICLQVRSSVSTGKTRLTLVAGRFKKNKIALSFCPACGVNIETELEPSNDS